MNILFIGLGNLGAQIFDLLALRTKPDDHILVGGRNLNYLHQRTHFTLYAARQLGLLPSVEHTFLDVWNVEQTAHTIDTFQPNIIISSVTMQPSSAISQLPQPVFAHLAQAKAGPWMPLTLVLIYKLMQAVKQTGRLIPVLNGGSPDNSHAVLGKVGLAPTTGFGNLANIIPALTEAVASQMNTSLERIQVLLFGHNQVAHHLRIQGTPGEAPFHLTVLFEGVDVTEQLDIQRLFRMLPNVMNTEYTQLVSAASAVAIINALQHKDSTIIHAPGPNGLPGAYPMSVSTHGMEVVLPSTLTLDQAIRLNRQGQQLDGIDHIEDDGTVYFTEKNMAPLNEALGYECRRMPLSEVEDRAKELRAKYLAFASKYR